MLDHGQSAFNGSYESVQIGAVDLLVVHDEFYVVARGKPTDDDAEVDSGLVGRSHFMVIGLGAMSLVTMRLALVCLFDIMVVLEVVVHA